MRVGAFPLLARRAVIAGLPAVALVGCAKSAQPVGDDASLGDPKAPVKVIEYASVACPVCGRWYREVFAQFKAKYIDTGKVYYTFREMLVGDATEQSMAAAGFLLARCAGRDKYFKVVDAIFQNQNDIYNDPRGGLLKIAQANGLDEKKFTACVNDAAGLSALNNRVQNYVTVAHVDATPTFVVNGAPLEPGYHSLAELDAAIAAARKAK
ncbi:MAG: putative disulfide isomerase [Caulobacteraceae bacterium]|jgi:protein-disulfide isomerase|nr:putative disulfide isomerase [Caulobacteraceae bacterium]